jgi:hypothetical protein
MTETINCMGTLPSAKEAFAAKFFVVTFGHKPSFALIRFLLFRFHLLLFRFQGATLQSSAC